MRVNYDRELERELKSHAGERRRLLLHCCCGPCAGRALEVLAPHFEIGVFFYNPNIRPLAEYGKRLDALRLLLERLPAAKGVRLIERGYNAPDFDEIACEYPDEPEGGARCAQCIALRLDETARLSRECGYGLFCTTLTVGPRKNAAMINNAGQKAGGKYGVCWLPSDFKKRGGYPRSVELSKELGIYRQSYCGCGLGGRNEGSGRSDAPHPESG